VHPVAQSLRKITDEMSVQFLERRAAIEANLLALLAKEHSFVLGPPGTGKSQLIGELVSRLPGHEYFKALLSRTRPDAAILGPYNLPELRDKGNFHRKINGFLPTANLAFLDEIGKMSPVLGHDMLSILNEREYYEVNGGRSEQAVPLYTAFTASNELITDDSDDAAALWDRLLIRVVVDYIQESGNFAALLQTAVPGKAPAKTTVAWDDLTDVIDNVVPTITIPTGALQTVLKLRDELRAQEIRPSDRRWKQSMRVLQANAFLNGRSQVEEDDISVLRYTLWDTPEQIHPVERMTLSVSNPVAEKVLGILDQVEEIATGISSRRGQAIEAKAQYGTEVNGKLKVLSGKLGAIKQDALAAGRSTTKIDEADERLKAVRRTMYIELLDMEPGAIK
jgi:MoxR-like ATPase